MTKAKEAMDKNQTSAAQNERRPNEQSSSSSGTSPQATQTRSHPPGALRRRDAFWSGSPFGLMNQFAEEMDRMFENFGSGRNWLAPQGWGETGQTLWSPQVEVFERGGHLVVRADLPGLTKDDVKVNVTDDALTIQGERKQEHEENREGWYRSERSYGSFYRTLPLPEGINAEQAQCSFKDGVLEVTMPAPQRREPQRRQLEIK